MVCLEHRRVSNDNYRKYTINRIWRCVHFQSTKLSLKIIDISYVDQGNYIKQKLVKFGFQRNHAVF